MNTVNILCNLIPVYFKFVRKTLVKLDFLYESCKWNNLFKIKLINLLSLYTKRINLELNRNEKSNVSSKTRQGVQYSQGIDENLQNLKNEVSKILLKLDLILPIKNEEFQKADKDALQIFLERFSSLFHLHPLILEYYTDRLVRTEEVVFDKLIADRDLFREDSQLLMDEFKDQTVSQLEEKCESIRTNKLWQYDEYMDKEQNNQGLVRQSSAIVMYFLKNYENNDNKHQFLFWKIFHFSFINCKFEELNFEYFDSIINQTFERIAKILSYDKSYFVMDILKRLVQFEVKKEVSIRNFNIEFADVLKERLTEDDIRATFSPLYWTMNGNDVYIRHLEEIFGDRAGLLTSH